MKRFAKRLCAIPLGVLWIALISPCALVVLVLGGITWLMTGHAAFVEQYMDWVVPNYWNRYTNWVEK